MRLYADWQPTTLDEIVGQPCVARLKHFLAHPRNDCLLLHGPSGVGKTTASEAILTALGTDDFPSTIYRANGTKFCLEVAESFFEHNISPFRFKSGPFWHCLLIEEAEWFHPQTINYLKDRLEAEVIKEPDRKIVVVATSNDVTNLRKNVAFWGRWRKFEFSGDLDFFRACQPRLDMIATLAGVTRNLTDGFSDDGNFSLRAAIDAIEDAAAVEEAVLA